MIYKLQSIIPPETKFTTVQRLTDGAFIPFDPANTDAQEFGRWLKDGNIPEPPDGGEPVTKEWIDQTIALLLPNG